MSLVERVLARPQEERKAYLREKCGNDDELFSRAWTYVEWDERMGSFLLDPMHPSAGMDAPFTPGQLILDRFRILREVARGGMGIVWEATDEKMDLRVAIKCAKLGFGQQLPPEVRAAREISHPNVCNIHDIHMLPSPQGAVDFISMEFLEGETLSERLRRLPALSKQESHSIALQLCAGLAEAHRCGVIHGDLKSNNIILTSWPDGSTRAVIMDFGLARRQKGAGLIPSLQGLAGTPAYMAPELWKGAKVSIQSDIYALGVVLWEIVSGRSPGDIGASSATLQWGERRTWKLPPWNGRWKNVIACCLKEDPAQRFKDVKQVALSFGLSPRKRWFLLGLAASLLAATTGLITYQGTTVRRDPVRLALLPFTSNYGAPEKLLPDTASQLARLKSSDHTDFKFISEDKVLRNNVDTGAKAHDRLGATHVLRTALEERQPGIITLHAYLTDTRNAINRKEWMAEYKSDELRYVPGALAGVVSGALHLPSVEASVNAAAQSDYNIGLASVRRESGVDAALETFGRAQAADPNSPLTYAGLGEAQWFKYFITRDKDWLNRAKESVRQAEKRNPDLPQVRRIAGLLNANAGRYEQAIADYSRAIELDTANGDAHRRLGEVYQRNDQMDNALAEFVKAVEADPKQYRNYGDLGAFYLQRGDYEEAARQFRTAIPLAPAEATIHYSLGVAEADLGQFSSAEKELQTSIRLRENPNALHVLGLVLIYEGKDRQAINSIRRALDLGPERYLWWMNLGIAYRRAGLLSEAEQAYRRGFDMADSAVVQDPRNGTVRAHLAYLCTQLGEKRRAESEIAQALQRSTDADTRYVAALTYEALGNRSQTLSVLADSPTSVIDDVNRWPDVADLHQDPRFLQLLASRHKK